MYIIDFWPSFSRSLYLIHFFFISYTSACIFTFFFQARNQSSWTCICNSRLLLLLLLPSLEIAFFPSVSLGIIIITLGAKVRTHPHGQHNKAWRCSLPLISREEKRVDFDLRASSIVAQQQQQQQSVKNEIVEELSHTPVYTALQRYRVSSVCAVLRVLYYTRAREGCSLCETWKKK